MLGKNGYKLLVNKVLTDLSVSQLEELNDIIDNFLALGKENKINMDERRNSQ